MQWNGFSLGLKALLICLLLTGPTLRGQSVSTVNGPSNATQGVEDPLTTARRLIAEQKLPEAEAMTRAYLQDHPESGPGHYLMGMIYFREDKPKDSLPEFTRGAALMSPTANDLKIVALDYVLLNDYEDAQKWLIQSTTKDPSDPAAWYSLGRVQYKLNMFPEAEKSFRRSLELEPHSVKAEDNLGLTLAALNRSDEAEAAYRHAISWQTDSIHPSEQPLLNLGSLLIERNQLEEATKLLEQAIRIAPADPKIHEQLGRVYSLQENFALAATHLEQAVALLPSDSRLHFQLGQVYRKLGKPAKAKVEFERTEALSGTHSTPE